MAVLVDECVWPWRDRRWCHLVSDAGLAELHAFAERLGLPRRAFQGDHYDLDETLRAEAIGLGADAVTGRELVVRLVNSGLRLQPHDRRAAAALGAEVVLAVRPAELARDGDFLAVQLGDVPGGTDMWSSGWGRAGDVGVVADDGNRVGAAVCRVVDGAEVASVAVAVARPCRGRGIGASLLAGLCERAAQVGHRRVLLVLPAGAVVLERLARRTGFEDTGEPRRLERRFA